MASWVEEAAQLALFERVRAVGSKRCSRRRIQRRESQITRVTSKKEKKKKEQANPLFSHRDGEKRKGAGRRSKKEEEARRKWKLRTWQGPPPCTLHAVAPRAPKGQSERGYMGVWGPAFKPVTPHPSPPPPPSSEEPFIYSSSAICVPWRIFFWFFLLLFFRSLLCQPRNARFYRTAPSPERPLRRSKSPVPSLEPNEKTNEREREKGEQEKEKAKGNGKTWSCRTHTEIADYSSAPRSISTPKRNKTKVDEPPSNGPESDCWSERA